MMINCSEYDPSEAGPRAEDIRLIARIAWLYYVEGLSQQEIGDRMTISRISVGRMLQRARDEGIVQINIIPPGTAYFNLEQQLCSRFGLRDALVTVDAEPGDSLYRVLAQAAAGWLTAHLNKGTRVGLGMGRTISRLPLFFQQNSRLDCSFVEVVGGAVDPSGVVASYNITSKMAELAGGRAEYVYAPLIVSSLEACQALYREPTVFDALERARQCDILLQSIGTVDRSAILYVHRYIDDKDLAYLQQCGAVGDMLGRYFDFHGQEVDFPLHKRIIGLGLEDAKKIPWSVVVAGGIEKVPAIKAALEGKLLNVLITDWKTARAILS